MSILTLGRKSRVINNASDFKAVFSNSGVYAGQNGVLHLPGIGHFPIAETIGTIIATRGVAGRKHKVTLIPANITVAAVTEDTEVRVRLNTISDNTEVEFEQHAEGYGKNHSIPITVSPDDTPAIVLKKIHDSLLNENMDADTLFDHVQVDSITYATPGDATTAVVSLVLVSREEGLRFDISFADEDNYATSKIVKFSATAPVVVFNFGGLNTYKTLRTEFIETPATMEEYGLEGRNLPIKGALYSSIVFANSHKRTDVSTSAAADTPVNQESRFEILIREDAGGENDDLRTLILNALLTKSGQTIVYYGGTGAIAADRAAYDA